MGSYECVCVVTFYLTLKALSVLLEGWLLVRLLVVLLGALTVVVHPLNGVLLHRITIQDFFFFFMFVHHKRSDTTEPN